MDQDVRVGDLWFIALDKRCPFDSYAKMRIIAFTTNQFRPLPVGQYVHFPGMNGKATEIGWPCVFLKLLERDGIQLAEDPNHDWEKWNNDPELREYLKSGEHMIDNFTQQQLRQNDAVISQLLEIHARIMALENERGDELAHRYEVIKLEIEKIIAYFDTFILENNLNLIKVINEHYNK